MLLLLKCCFFSGLIREIRVKVLSHPYPTVEEDQQVSLAG